MPTDYNKIAQEYKQAKQQGWRKDIETFTVFELLGDLTGKSVLDLACGEGFYSRLLKHHGAARVVGIDLSERMIEMAKEEEARQPLGIEYLVGDVKQLVLDERFDLVFAGYLLNYARTPEELLQMCRAIARCLRPGGRFVSANSNPDHPLDHFLAGKKYGFVKSTPGALQEGAPINWRFQLDDRWFEITNYYLSIPTHEKAFREAGFQDIRWHPPRVSPAGLAEFGEEYWAEFLQYPSVHFIECVKTAT